MSSMRCRLSILPGLLLLAADLSAAANPPEQAVIDLVAEYSRARKSRDADALAEILTADADQLVSSGVWRRGRAELVEGMLASSHRNPGERSITVETVRFVTPDVAVATARYVISPGGDAEPRRMWSTFVAHRTANGWRIAAIRNMLPARGIAAVAR